MARWTTTTGNPTLRDEPQMSVKVMAWAWAQNVPPATKAVLLALADHADDDGIAWPGRKGLAVKLGIDDRNVTRHIAKLIGQGLVSSTPQYRPDGSQSTNLYRLSLNDKTITPPMITLSPPLDENVQPPSAKSSSPLDEIVHPSLTIMEPSLEPSERREPPKSPVTRGTRKVGLITQDFIDLMVTEWSPKIGGEERTRNTIATAMNHKSMDKYKDKRLYLKNWLRRDAETYGKEHTNGRTTTPVGGFDNSHDKYVQAALSDPKPLRSTPAAT